jgi:hypothetical protein
MKNPIALSYSHMLLLPVTALRDYRPEEQGGQISKPHTPQNWKSSFKLLRVPLVGQLPRQV